MKTLLSILLASISFSFAQFSVIGKAYRTDNNSLAYTESRIQAEGRNYSAEYSDKNGKLFSLKKVKYPSQRPWGPLVSLEDYNHDYKLEVVAEGPQKIRVNLKKDGEFKSESFKVKPDHIWDSGIHYFIVDNWDKLKTTQTREVFILELMRFIEFDFTRDENDRVEMKISNTLLSWFVDPIYIQYDSQANMLTYNGVSDIKDPKGDQLDVKIRYSYPK